MIDSESKNSKASMVFEAGFDGSGSYHQKQDASSKSAVRLGYSGQHLLFGVAVHDGNLFIVPYIQALSLALPGLAVGVKSDQAYAALYLNEYPHQTFGTHPFSLGGQVGMRVNERLILVADAYRIVYTDNDAPFLFNVGGDLRERQWALRMMPTLHLGEIRLNLNPYLFYIPEQDLMGGGASLSVAVF
jgi:hypothetical protein